MRSRPPQTTMRYGQVRLGWCAGALARGLRRWGIYIVASVAMLGALAGSMDSAVLSMRGLAGLLVAPLFDAAERPFPQTAGPIMLAHSLIGAMLIWALRPVLWPRDWAEAENALPIGRLTGLRSDLLVVGISLLPLLVAYFAGALASRPAWPHQAFKQALALLLGSLALSLLWGVGMLQGMRQSLRGRARPGIGSGAPVSHDVLAGLAPMSTWMALVLRPLLHGPARRTGQLLGMGTLALLGHAFALVRWPHQAAVVLACYAAASLALTARLNVTTAAELKPLHEACQPLPVRADSLRLARGCVPLLPVAVADVAMALALLGNGIPMRPWMLAAFFVAHVLGCLAQVLPQRQPSPQARLGAWWFTLALLIALASEALV